MDSNHIYIMSVAASGKSTFAGRFPEFGGYRVIDFATLLPRRTILTRSIQFAGRAIPSLRRFLDHRPDIVAANEDNYFRAVFRMLGETAEPLAVLGRRLPDDLGRFDVPDDIHFGLVLIPEADHERNCASRAKRWHNSLPFFAHPTTHLRNMQEGRERARAYAEARGIPVFEDFPSAIQSLGSMPTVRGTH